MIKQKKKIIFLLAMTIILNLTLNSIIAIGFDPTSEKDDETNKEYTAELLDLQFNTAVALLLDEFSDTNTPLTLIGALKINHTKDSNVEILKTIPTLKLVNQKGESTGTVEIYQYEETDTYYFDIYDLNINNNDQYKLLVSITDNYGKSVEKYVTYDDSIFICEHPNGTMSYKGINNIATVSFNLGEENVLKGDLDKNGILTEEDVVILNRIYLGIDEATEEELSIGDMNDNGKIELTDVISLINLAGITKGDLNVDTLVDSADAAIALNIFKYNSATAQDIVRGDMDGNGIIDSADAAMILNEFKYSI